MICLCPPCLRSDLWPHSRWSHLYRTPLLFPEESALFPASVSLFMLFLLRVSFPASPPGDPSLILPVSPIISPLFQEAFWISPGRIRASSPGHLLHFFQILCDRHLLRWLPEWVTSSYIPYPITMLRNSDWLLTNNIWRKWQRVIPLIRLPFMTKIMVWQS